MQKFDLRNEKASAIFLPTLLRLMMCCSQKMKGIIPVTVKHPVLSKHYLEWVPLRTKQENQQKMLQFGDKTEVCFATCKGNEVEAVYAYCNLHSIWKA